jgi:hypothetical protein
MTGNVLVDPPQAPESDRRVAPALALVATGIVALCLGFYAILYIV